MVEYILLSDGSGDSRIKRRGTAPVESILGYSLTRASKTLPLVNGDAPANPFANARRVAIKIDNIAEARRARAEPGCFYIVLDLSVADFARKLTA